MVRVRYFDISFRFYANIRKDTDIIYGFVVNCILWLFLCEIRKYQFYVKNTCTHGSGKLKQKKANAMVAVRALRVRIFHILRTEAF